jgi:hypothetical protein
MKAMIWTIAGMLVILISMGTCENGKVNDIVISRGVITNSKEVLVATYQYTATGELSAITKNEYDVDGNWIEMRYYGADKELFSIIQFEYDSNGYRTKVIHYEGNGELFSYTEIENNSDGKQKRALHYDAHGVFGGSEKNEYNSEGKLIKARFYHAVDEEELSLTIVYEYDSNGNMITQKGHDPQGTLIHTWEFEYDTEGRSTRLTYYGTTHELPPYHIDYEYNFDGKNMKARQYDLNGELNSYTIYVNKTI